ncbi:MAG: hypothetical protein PHW33_03825, partial [Candidatus Portnoybacteria bacterium]|nr:hypothetical protein [Candidatus Portnoybacteria bacterium]
ADKRLASEPRARSASRWWEKEEAAPVSLEPAFAVARLSPAGAAERELPVGLHSGGPSVREWIIYPRLP